MTGHSDTIVPAYGLRYSTAFARLLKTEGGLVDDPKDHGGITKYGISLRFLVAEGTIDLDGDGVGDFDLDMDGDINGADIRALTPADAKFLYHRCFWVRGGCDRWPAPIGEMIFDQGVNGGMAAARKLLQRAINLCLIQRAGFKGRPGLLADDGQLGPMTRAAFDWVLMLPASGMTALVLAYRRAAADRYKDIVARDPSQVRFLRGWLNRAADLGKY